MGAPELKPEKVPKERRTDHSGSSFEAWVRSLEAAGLTFDSVTRRWNLLHGTRNHGKAIQLEKLVLIYRRSQILSEQVTYKLDLHRWRKMTQNAAKEIFGPRTRTELHNDFNHGQPDGVWLVLEFTRPNSRETSMGYSHLFDNQQFQTGFLALKITMQMAPAGFHLSINDVAGLGYSPPSAWDNMHAFIRRSLGLPGVARLARVTVQKSEKKDGNEAGNEDRKETLELSIGITELIGIKEPDYEPMIQRALEESAQENRHALANAQPVLNSSGNLIWTAATSANYENTNPGGMTRSQIGDAQASRSRQPVTLKKAKELIPPIDGVTLEGISQMIRGLSLTWPSFESSSIATTILSEILGDCWASQAPSLEGNIDPFKLAKTAWERAGSMRANQLRMLRKIAVAARSHGRFGEERKALCELIQFEKRRDVLAGAMVRITQISMDGSDEKATELDVEKLLFDVASMAPRDEQVNFSCFNQMVESGLFPAAIHLGNELLNDPIRIQSARAKAEIAITMSRLSASEMQDEQKAIAYLNYAKTLDPSSTMVMSEIAAFAARTNNRELEADALFLLADTFYSNGAGANQSTSDFEAIAAENSLRALLINTTTSVSDAKKQRENPLDTTRTLTLLTRPFEPERTIPASLMQWLGVLGALLNRSDFQILRPTIVRTFIRISNHGNDQRNVTDDPDTIARLAFGLVNPMDVSEGKEILAAATRLLSHWAGGALNSGMSITGAYVELLEKIAINPEHTDWMTKYAPELFSFLEPQLKVPIISKALETATIRNTGWLCLVVDQTISSHPLQIDPPKDGSIFSNLDQLARLSFAATDAAVIQSDSVRAKEILFRAITRSEDLLYVFLGAFEAESAGARREFLLEALVGATVHALDGGIGIPILNSRIRSLILRFRPEFRSSKKEINDAVGKVLFDSICLDGQSMPLDESEIDFLLNRGSLNGPPEILQCLVHQASVDDNPSRASELFKICLDHVILELNDEAHASRIITAWLIRLKPKQSPSLEINELTGNTKNKLDDLAAELIQLLKELDQKLAESLLEQLGNMGFINLSDPVPAIAGACRNEKFETARNMFRRALAGATGSEGDLAIRLYQALEQMDFKPGLKKPDKNSIISLLLDWYGDPSNSGIVPIELALLASQHMNDRHRARSTIEKIQSSLDIDSPEENRLWIPYYMLLSETGTKEEVDRQLDKILPKLRQNPGLLSSYPFTVESLEAERWSGTAESETIPASPAAVELSMSFELLDNVDEGITLDAPDLTPPPLLLADPTPELSEPAGATAEPVEFETSIEILTDAPLQPEPIMTIEEEVEAVQDTEAEAKVDSPPTHETLKENIEVPLAKMPILIPTQSGTDWRAAVRHRKLTHESTAQIFDTEMPNKIEKHVALQAVAAMRGESHVLDRWDWRVWRKPHEYGYSRQGKNRFPAGLSPRIMKTPAFRLLMRAAPLLAMCFPERFTLKGLAKSLKLSLRQIEAKRQRLNWTTGIAGHAGFGFHSKLFSERGLCLFALQGLGPEIFYDAASSSIYIDDSFFARKPPTHLYHRIMFLLYSIRTQFYPLLNLTPETQILAELNKLKAVMDRGPIAVFAAQAKITDSRMAKFMKTADFEEFKQLFSRSGELNGDDIKDSCKSMQQYVWRLLLADSLDLTGIIEAMLDVDLLLPGSVKPGEILLMSSQVDPLINFALALKLEEPSIET